jgi:hypothetical protein
MAGNLPTFTLDVLMTNETDGPEAPSAARHNLIVQIFKFIHTVPYHLAAQTAETDGKDAQTVPVIAKHTINR